MPCFENSNRATEVQTSTMSSDAVDLTISRDESDDDAHKVDFVETTGESDHSKNDEEFRRPKRSRDEP